MVDMDVGHEMIAEQTTGFLDTAVGTIVSDETKWQDIDTSDGITDAALSEFLSRPVRINSVNLLTTDPIGVVFLSNPWQEYFNTPAIKKKLDNYAFLRARLKIKVVVNASPFYYGALRLVYTPLPNFHPDGIINNADIQQVPLSQKPGLWIYPQENAGGEMELPFFWPKNFLTVNSSQEFTDMGQLVLYNWVPMRSANGAAGQGISIQLFAWAEEVVLAGPTTALALQGKGEKTEYGLGPVSAPATTVARMASHFKKIPVIGKFATATEMGATAVAGIAQLFGFTNVPVIDPPAPMRQAPYPQIASTSIGYPVEKLTVDPKNELSIDGSIVGHTSEDELAVLSLVTRQSFLTTTTWTTTTPVDTPLFTSLVTPHLFRKSTPNGDIYMTPMDMVARLFANWRGDVIFTFKIAASKFHKGRLRISYDPGSAGVQTTGDTGPFVHNQIVDLGEHTTVDVRIPYQQALAWLYTSQNTTELFTTSSTPALALDSTTQNGILSVKVLTLLSAPVATSSVSIVVLVRAADNFEVANPCIPPVQYSQFGLQGTAEEIGEEIAMGNCDDTVRMDRSRVYMGENVRSLRHLLRRVNLVDTTTIVSANTGLTSWTFGKYPPWYGYDPNGGNTARNVGNTANVPFNWSQNSPYSILAPCFIAQRGSVHWHIGPKSNQPLSHIALSRVAPASTLTNSFLFENLDVATSGGAARQMWRRLWFTSAGGAVTSGSVQPVLSVSIPNYTGFKFQAVDPTKSTLNVASGSKWDGSDREAVRLEYLQTGQACTTIQIMRHFGVGTDFSLLFFLNVPTWRIYSSTPGAPT